MQAAVWAICGTQVCCLSGEAKRPLVDVPLSVALSLAIITAAHVLAALALSGEQ